MKCGRVLDVPTNLAIDDRLIEEAKRIGGYPTKRAAVTAALEEYVRRRRQLGILQLAGKVDYDPAYDHKLLRRRSRR
jgi:Arc/MetJ family transcription regulator